MYNCIGIATEWTTTYTPTNKFNQLIIILTATD